jgi:REP element-mobilizing transposase RayT
VVRNLLPQLLSKVILHIDFSTKDREKRFHAEIRPRVHAYLATVCRELGADVPAANGVADHVHILTTLPRTIAG